MFSELVDEAVVRTGRRDRINDIKSYAHQAIRECQMLSYFARDMVEDTLTADASPYVWTRPSLLRLLRTARYTSDIYPRYAAPGQKQSDYDYFYYGGPTYFVFSGVASGETVDVAYYTYARRFTYFASGARPAVYDRDAQTWSYLSGGVYVASLGSTTLNEAAQALVTNWLLTDWYDLILEGAVAKLFKNLSDARAGSSFALFKSMQDDLKAGEQSETLGV